MSKEKPTDGTDLNEAPPENQSSQEGGTRHGGIIPVTYQQMMTATGTLAEEAAIAVRWLYAYARTNKLGTAELAAKLKKPGGGNYNSHTIYSLFRGTYGAKPDAVVTSIAQFKKVIEARETVRRPDFIRTKLVETIYAICQDTLSYQRITLVYGDGQTGKTTAFQSYALENNHGLTRYVRLPGGGGLGSLLRAIGRACFVGSNLNNEDTTQAILESLDSQNLLIIDELQQVCLIKSPVSRLRFFELIKMIFDQCKCGIVLVGTSEARAEIEKGENAVWMRQFRRRALPPTVLKAFAEHEEILAFAAHYGFPGVIDNADAGELVDS